MFGKRRVVLRLTRIGSFITSNCCLVSFVLLEFFFFTGNCSVRFATQAKFHLDSGGGGPESNLKLLPYLIQATLYVLNQTKQQSLYRELVENHLSDLGSIGPSEIKGPLFVAIAALLTVDHAQWKKDRIKMLESLLVLNQKREKTTEALPFEKVKSALISGSYSIDSARQSSREGVQVTWQAWFRYLRI